MAPDGERVVPVRQRCTAYPGLLFQTDVPLSNRSGNETGISINERRRPLEAV